MNKYQLNHLPGKELLPHLSTRGGGGERETDRKNGEGAERRQAEEQEREKIIAKLRRKASS